LKGQFVAQLAFDRVVSLRFDFAWRSEERIEMLRRLENDKLTSEIEKRCLFARLIQCGAF
jgi:hypothetical protein